MVFHEITAAAIQAAIDNPRDLDQQLVDAQEARRILDRLYGYEVSPVLWSKVLPRLSAGRVQSVATRIVVERERARMRVPQRGLLGLEGTFAKAEPRLGRDRPLRGHPGQRRRHPLATGKDFDETGQLGAKADVVVLDEAAAAGLAARLADADFAVRSVDAKPYRRSPSRRS